MFTHSVSQHNPAPAPIVSIATQSLHCDEPKSVVSTAAFEMNNVTNRSINFASTSYKKKATSHIRHLGSDVKEAMRSTPKKLSEGKIAYAARLKEASPHLSITQLAAAANVEKTSLTNSPLFRVDNENVLMLKRNFPRAWYEMPMAYAIRLQEKWPNLCKRDYAMAAGVPLSTLADHAKFQTLSATAKTASELMPRLIGETDLDWGLRLQQNYGLNKGECSAVTSARVDTFRRSARFSAGEQAAQKKRVREEFNVITNAFSTVEGKTREIAALKSEMTAQEMNVFKVGLTTFRDMAELMLRPSGVYNNQFGDQLIHLLINSGKLPENIVISVRVNNMWPIYLRADPAISMNQGRMSHERLIELQRGVVDGDDGSAHYNLLRDGKLVANNPDGDCLYRAIAQGLDVDNIPETIKKFRGYAADEFISNAYRYIEALDTELLYEEYKQLCIRRTEEGILAASNESQTGEKTVYIRLVELLHTLYGVYKMEPRKVFDWLNKEQVIRYAAMAIMSGEAEKLGAVVIKTTAEILLNLLNKNAYLRDDVFSTLFPTNEQDKLAFVNTLPLIMNQTAGLRVMQIFKELSINPTLRNGIKNLLRKEYVAERPVKLEYMASKDFFKRVEGCARVIARMALVDDAFYTRNNVDKALILRSESNMEQSIALLGEAGLNRAFSFANPFFVLDKSSRKPTKKRTKDYPGLIYQDPPAKIGDDDLQMLQREDKDHYDRFMKNTLAMRNHMLHMKSADDEIRARNQKLATLAASTLLGVTALHSANLAAQRNAEKDREWENDKEAGKRQDRMIRDYSSETLRQQSLSRVTLDTNMAMSFKRPTTPRTSAMQIESILQRRTTEQRAVNPLAAGTSSTTAAEDIRGRLTDLYPNMNSQYLNMPGASSSQASGTSIANLFDVEMAQLERVEGIMDNLSEINLDIDSEALAFETEIINITDTSYQQGIDSEAERYKIDARMFNQYQLPILQQQQYGPLNENRVMSPTSSVMWPPRLIEK